MAGTYIAICKCTMCRLLCVTNQVALFFCNWLLLLLFVFITFKIDTANHKAQFFAMILLGFAKRALAFMLFCFRRVYLG